MDDLTPLDIWWPLVNEAMPDALFIHDHSGRLIEVNRRACQSLGYSKNELLEMGVADIEPDFDLTAAQAAWQAIAPGGRTTLRAHQRRRDGSVFPVEINFGLLVRGDHRLYLGVARDISRQLALEAKLVAAGQALHQTEQQSREEIARQLAASERRYHAMVESMAEGSVLHAADGRIVACNPAAEKILGLTADQLLQRTSFDPRWAAVHADGSPFEGEHHPAMVTLRSGLPVRAQLMGIDDGRSARRWISVTAVPLRTGTGAGHDAALVTFEDVTERLRYQQEAEALLRRQRRIMDSALLGAWITREDQCTWANSRAAHLLGYTLAQLVGSPAHRIHRDAAHYNALAARAQAVLHRGEVFHADVELQRQDGCAAWFELRGVLLDPLAGEILWTIVDLGARVHSEAALIEALQESADLYDGAPAGYHTIGADGLILRMNATELRWLDYRRDEVIGRRHFSDFLSPDSRAAADAMLLKSPRPGEDYGLEVDLVRRDGSLMPVLINASPVTDAAGSYVMARCIVIDLSALRAAQQQLLRSEQAYLAVIQDLRLQVARGAPPR